MSDEVIDVKVEEVVNDSPDQWEFEWEDGGGRCEKCRRNKYCSMKEKGCGPIKRHRKKQQEEMIKQLMKQAKEAQEKAAETPEVIDGEFTEVEPQPELSVVNSQPQVGNLNRI